jgi:hypothetical protein
MAKTTRSRKLKPEKKSSYDDHCPNCREDIREALQEWTSMKRIHHERKMEMGITCPKCSQEMRCEVIVDFHLHYIEDPAVQEK